MKILIVEDDLSLSDVLAFTLRRVGYEVLTAFDGITAVERWETERPGLIVLDLNLPKLDGLAVCRHIRQQSQTPIIILSVRDEDEAIVQGLELGADDYVVKPFSPNQLVARIKAVARRAGMVSNSSGTVLEAAGLVFERARHEVKRLDRAVVRLTPLEAKLLERLLLHQGQVLSSEMLITAVWGSEGGDRTMLKQLVYRLRAKIDTDTAGQSLIETIPGLGYSFSREQ